MLIVALSDKVPMAIKISYIYHKKRGVLRIWKGANREI